VVCGAGQILEPPDTLNDTRGPFEHTHTHTHTLFKNQRAEALPGAIYQPQETGHAPEGLVESRGVVCACWGGASG